ncbi:hypothetical protein ACJMK2_034269 [Sinanodonta woodiana]|uniref:Uncharacterized protein n=1 Tax=Sinanodonta woodiana TaxID=1069815 RepID=A0ABD3WSD4_SINWO
MGTGYHSDVEVHGTQNEANITTILYPGSNYILKLYAVHNGTKSLFGTRFIRSACGDKFNTTLGSQYIILSPSYPNGYNAGVVCRWYFYGNYVTWFKVILWDYDIEGTEKCSNSLQVSDAPTLCHPVERNHFLVVKNSSMSLQMMNKFTGPGRGMNVSVVAFHSIDQPRNIVANLSSHDLHLTWIPPLLHPNNFTYMLYISFPPYHGDDLVHMIPADQNEYRLNVSDHIGQMLVIGISAKSPELESNRTYANIYFACSTNIHIPPEGVIFVTSPRYPLGFHAGVNCRWYVYTEPDFFILVTRADIDIGGTGGCTDAYIDITSLGKHCVAIESGSVIPANSVNISFSSGSITSGRGFNITVESVAKPSDPPEHVLGVVNHTHIHVTWGEPPRRSQHIIGFFVEYFIAPHTLGASLYTERGTREAFISTEHQSGKMFIIRVASVTKGGKGNYSNPLYVRSVCETTVTLSQHQTSLIFSPLVNNNGNYQPGIVCKWIIQTAEPLWLQITIEKFALEQSTGCSKDYLEISGHRKLCGQIWNQSFLLKKTSTNITFVSDFDTEDSGFVIAVSAVGPPPGLPQNVSVVSSQYGLICTWDSPKQNEMYVIGYHLTYIIHPERTNHTVEIARDTRLYAIDTTYIPGRLIEVYIQAKGDVESGPTSRSELARSSCGQDYSLTKGRRLYISSPKFPSQYDISVSCNWSIMLADLYSVRLSFITLDLINMEGHNCSNDYVKISGLGVFCDKAVENSQFILQSIQRIQITFESDETGNGKGFLLQLDVINGEQSSYRTF